MSHQIEQNHRLALAKGNALKNPSRYRLLVGCLIYLGVTHLELLYAIQVLSQFMKDPKTDHWDAAIRVAYYLKGNLSQGILLRANSDLKLTTWSDSDWGG